jgi:hypothetical protein
MGKSLVVCPPVEAVRVFTAEHLAAIALQTGRSKDKLRLLQFVESGVLDAAKFQDMGQTPLPLCGC